VTISPSAPESPGSPSTSSATLSRVFVGTAISELSHDSSIKVILADLEMPSWTNIVQQAHSRIPESYILGMLRYGAVANALEAQRLGAHGYLIKPLEFAEVNQRIQRFLTGQSLIKI
jgi:DNA-binding NtrC family response regulator